MRVIFYYTGLSLVALLLIYLSGRYAQFGGGLPSVVEESMQLAESYPPSVDGETPRASFSFENFAQGKGAGLGMTDLFSTLARGFPNGDLILRIILKRSILSLLIGLFFFGILCAYLGCGLFSIIFTAIVVVALYPLGSILPVLGLLTSSTHMPPLPLFVIFAVLTAYFGTLLGDSLAGKWHSLQSYEVE